MDLFKIYKRNAGAYYLITVTANITQTGIFIYAALTHTSRPYCDLITSKIAFFFRKSFGFLSKFLSQTVRGSAVLCSVRFLYVLNTTLLRPWRFHCDYIASPRPPHGDHRRPRCDCATFSASLRRLYGDYCVCPATVLRLYEYTTSIAFLIASLLRCCCDYGDSTAIPRRPNQDSAQSQSSATVLCMFKIVADGLRPCASLGSSLRLRCVPAASMATLLRPGSYQGRSKVARYV